MSNVQSMSKSNVIPIFKSKSFRPKRVIGPIEHKMRLVLDKLKDSKYPDSFDWSLYDKIASRHADADLAW